MKKYFLKITDKISYMVLVIVLISILATVVFSVISIKSFSYQKINSAVITSIATLKQDVEKADSIYELRSNLLHWKRNSVFDDILVFDKDNSILLATNSDNEQTVEILKDKNIIDNINNLESVYSSQENYYIGLDFNNAQINKDLKVIIKISELSNLIPSFADYYIAIIVNFILFLVLALCLYIFIYYNLIGDFKPNVANYLVEGRRFKAMTTIIKRLNSNISKQQVSFAKKRHEIIADKKQKMQFLSENYEDSKMPLIDMLAAICLLKSSTMNKEQTRYVNILQSSLKKLELNLKEAQDFTKIESGDFDQEFREFNLEMLLQDLYSHYKDKAQRKHIRLTLTIPENMPQNYKSDPVRISQILNKLLANAIEFSKGGSHIDVFVDVQQQFDDIVEMNFVVKDFGSYKFKQSKFNKLINKISSNMANYSLVGVQKIVEYMGGIIKIESSGFRGGIKFSVNLPLNVV